MHPKILELFGNRIYGAEFLKLYEDMANTYTGDCIEQLYEEASLREVPLSFTEISARVASFNNELINRATWIRDDYKENKGYSSPKLTRGCKKIISRCVKDYLRAMQLANRTTTFQPA
jgi:hypothetical protein